MSGMLTIEDIKAIRDALKDVEWLKKNYDSEKRARDSIPSLISLQINDFAEKQDLKIQNKLHDYVRTPILDKVEDRIIDRLNKSEESCDVRVSSLENSRAEVNGFVRISKWVGGIILAGLAIFGITLSINHG